VIARLVTLALEYYREPLAYRHLTDFDLPLPGGFDRLLSEFCGALSAIRIEETAKALSTNPDELIDAARFFVRHVLLDPAADYYRHLGLERDASQDAIRHHYQLLIRMFHPDRIDAPPEVATFFASRINLAYHTLRDPETRAAYDRGLPLPLTEASEADAAWFFRPAGPLVEIKRPRRRRRRRALLSGTSRERVIVVGGLGIASMGLFAAYLVWEGTQKPTARLVKTDDRQAEAPLPSFLARKSDAPGQADPAGSMVPAGSVLGTAGVDLPTDAGIMPPMTAVGVSPAGAGALRASDLAGHRVGALPLPSTVPGGPPARLPSADDRLNAVVETGGRDLLGANGEVPLRQPIAPVPLDRQSREPFLDMRMPAAPSTATPARDLVPATSAAAIDANQGQAHMASPPIPTARVTEAAREALPSAPARARAPTEDANATRREGPTTRRPDAKAASDQQVLPARTTTAQAPAQPESPKAAMNPRKTESQNTTDPPKKTEGQNTAKTSKTTETPKTTAGASRSGGVSGTGHRSAPAPTAESIGREPRSAGGVDAPAPETVGERLMARLESAYRTGDADSFAGAFTADGRTNDGQGRGVVRSTYADIFKRIPGRKLSFTGMTWRVAGDGRIMGRGRVRVSNQHREGGSWQHAKARVEFVLVRGDDGYRIASMLYSQN
jgi:hypothetical protein